MRSKALQYLSHPIVLFSGLWAAFSAVFMLRYPYALTVPNFYAEDGKIFVANVLALGPIEATLQLFNGYLVIGQYIVTLLGFTINFVAGGEIETLPKALALASYMFLGLMATLPWLLFRRQMGTAYSLLAGMLIAFVPLGAADWTVIGTIGNLKFAFFYLAFMLIMYRNAIALTARKQLLTLIDVLLVICALTNIACLPLLLLVALPYTATIKKAFSKRKIQLLYRNAGLVSLVVKACFLAVYVATVYLMGIPKNPGYLDQALSIDGLMNTLYRGSLYGLLYPLQASMTTFLAIMLMIAAVATWVLLKRGDRMLLLCASYAMLINALVFVLARPGVTQYYTVPTETGGPGQFFYGGTMICIFIGIYLLSQYAKLSSIRSKALFGTLAALYLVWAMPLAGYRSESLGEYSSVQPIVQSVSVACAAPRDGESVDISVYPSSAWYMTVDRDAACD